MDPSSAWNQGSSIHQPPSQRPALQASGGEEGPRGQEEDVKKNKRRTQNTAESILES